MKKAHGSLFAVLLVFLLCCLAGAQAEDLFSLTQTEVEENWYTYSGRNLDYYDLRNGYIAMSSYNASLGESSWVLTQDSGPEDILRIEGEKTTGDYVYIEFSKDSPAIGDYAYTLSCTWQGETHTANYILHILEAPYGKLNGIVQPDIVTVPLGESASITLELDPSGWELPGESESVSCYIDDSSTVSASVDGKTVTFTGHQPGVYRVRYYYSCGGFSVNKTAFVKVLNEDGSEPAYEYNLSQTDVEKTVYVLSNRYYKGNTIDDTYLGITNYVYVEGQVPEFTLTFLNGPEDAAELYTYGFDKPNYGTSCYLQWKAEHPMPGDYTYRMDCTYMGTVRSCTCTIHVSEPPYGELKGIVSPETITVGCGEAKSVAFELDPAGWELPGVTPNWSFSVNNSQGNWAGEELSVSNDGNTFTLTGNTPGYYTLGLYYSCSGFYANKTIEVIVLNEDGSKPEFDYSIYTYKEDRPLYLSSNRSYQGYTFGEFHINNYRQHADELPSWEFVLTDGPSDVLGLQYYTDYATETERPDAGCFKWIVNHPAEGEYTYELRCTWRGTVRSSTLQFSIQAPPAGDLTGMVKPTVLQVPLNGTAAISMQLNPADWSLPGYTPSWYCYVYNSYGSGSHNGNLETASATVSEDGTFTFTGHTTGYYKVSYYFDCGDFNAYAESTIIVLNEDGSVPEYAFELNTSADEVNVYVLDRMDYMGQYLRNSHVGISGAVPGDEDIEWTLTQVSGDQDILEFWNDGDSYRELCFSVSHPPVGTYVYEIGVTIRETTKTHTLTVNVQYPPYGELEGISKPDALRMQIGEKASVTLKLLPEGWSLPGESERVYCYVFDGEYDRYNGDYSSLRAEADGRTLTFTAAKPGYYTVRYYYSCSNFSASVSSSVVVLNEDGSEPEFDFILRGSTEINQYIVREDYSSTDVNDGYYSITNYSNDPLYPVEWSLDFISGPADALTFRPYNYSDRYSYDGYLRWNVNEPQIGDYVYDVNCSWHGTTKTIRVTLHALESPNGPVYGVTAPDSVSVRAGQTTSFTAALDPEGWSLPGEAEEWYMDLWDSDERWMNPGDNTCLQVTSDNGSYTLKGITPGYYRLYVNYSCAGVYLGKNVSVLVLNEDGSEPEYNFKLYGNTELKQYLAKEHDESFELNNSYYSIRNYINDPLYPVEWALNFVSGPEDVIVFRPNNYGDSYSYAGWLRSSVNMPQVGDYVYDLNCTWHGTTKSIRITIHVLESPNGPVYGVTAPDSVSVRAGETTVVAFALDPAGWTIPGETESWSIEVANGSDEWQEPATNSFVQVTSNNGSYTVKGITPGYYRLYVNYYCGGVSVGTNLPVVVLNEDGSEPEYNFTLRGSTEITEYLTREEYQSDELNNSYYYIRNYFDDPQYPVTWSMSFISGPEDAISFRTNNYENSFSYDGHLRWNTNSPKPGEYVYDINCSWHGTTKTIRVTIHVLESPNGPLYDVVAPDSISVLPGESTVITATLNPAGWTIPGETEYWSADVEDSNGDWMDAQANSCVQVTVSNSTYTVKGITPGYYRLYLNYYIAGVSMGRAVSVTVLNEDGTMPAFAIRLYSSEKTLVYYAGASDYLQTEVSGSYNGFDGYNESDGDKPAWSLSFVSGPSDSFVVGRWYVNRDYCYIQALNTNIAVGDYIYDLTCSWRGSEATARYTIHVVNPDEGFPEGLSGESEIELLPGSAEEFQYSLDPEDWGIADQTSSWSVYFSDPETGNRISSSILSTSISSDGVLSVTGFKPGIYNGDVHFTCSNIHIDYPVRIIVLNEDGSRPVLQFALYGYANDDLVLIDPERYSYIDRYLGEVYIRNYDSYDSDSEPAWSFTTSEGDESLYWTDSYGGWFQLYFAADPTEGTHSVHVTCTWLDQVKTFDLSYEVVRATAPESIVWDTQNQYIVKIGETFTVKKPVVTPADWNVNGETPYFNYDFSGCVQTGETEDTLTFKANEVGSWDGWMNLSCGSYRYDNNVSVLVTDENGQIPLEAYGYAVNNGVVYLQKAENTSVQVGYVSIDNYGSYSQIFDGEPVLTYTTNRNDVKCTLRHYHGADYWDWDILLESFPDETFDLTVDWTITWANASKSGSFEAECVMPDTGYPTGLKINDDSLITVQAGTPYTFTASMEPEGWTLNGNAPALRLSNTGDYTATVSGMSATITFSQPGWYTVYPYISMENYYFNASVAFKVTDASGHVDDPEEIQIYSLMASNYILGDSIYPSFNWYHALGKTEWDASFYLGGVKLPYTHGEDFTPSEAGTYSCVMEVSDALGRTATLTSQFTVTAPSALSVGSLTIQGKEGGILADISVHGGQKTPTVDYLLYIGRQTTVVYRSYQPQQGTRELFSSLKDGIYQVVVTVSDDKTSVTRASALCEIKSGKLTLFDGTMTLPSATVEIGSEAFEGIRAGTVICPNGLKTIDELAFKDSYVSRIVIPGSVTSISGNAFSGATSHLVVVAPSGSYAATWASSHGYLVETGN